MADGVRSVGTVKWFSGQKGFGFVAPDEDGDDLFVHQTEIQTDGFRTLREGQRVEFKVDREDGRSKAVEVVILERNYSSGGRRGGRFGRGRGGDGVECYNCGRLGHLARDCYSGSGGDGGYRAYGRGGGGGDGGYRAYVRGGGGGDGDYRAHGRGGGGDDGYSAYGHGGGGYRAYGRGGGGGRECYNCGEDGHFARDCPAQQS